MEADKYNYNFEERFLGVQAEKQLQITASLHLGTEWQWGEAFTLKPSLAAQTPLAWGGFSFEPRLRSSYQPGGSEHMKLTAAAGLYRQFVTGITDERDAGSTFRALVPTPFQAHPLQAFHALIGWTQRPFPNLRFSIEGWYKDLYSLPVPRWTPVVRFNTTLARANGTAFGADLSVRYERHPLRLDLSYGYGQITYRAARSDLGAWGDEPVFEYPPPHDLRHKVNATVSLATEWLTANVRWQYSSGLPFTKVYGFDNMLEVRGLRDKPFTHLGTPRALYHRPYQARLPAYHRLDVSLQRTFDVASSVQLSAEAGAINAYDRSNIFYIDIFTLDRVDQLPMLPYVSLTAHFGG